MNAERYHDRIDTAKCFDTCATLLSLLTMINDDIVMSSIAYCSDRRSIQMRTFVSETFYVHMLYFHSIYSAIIFMIIFSLTSISLNKVRLFGHVISSWSGQ